MDKINKAVALRYKPEKEHAPRVVAHGKGLFAEKIIEKAKQFGIPIREDPYLVELLMRLDMYQEIPQELYKVIAEIFAFVFQIKNMNSPEGDNKYHDE